MTDRYITRQTAADLLSCSVRTIDRMIAAGDLVRYTVRSGVRLSQADIDGYMARHGARSAEKSQSNGRYITGMKIV